MEGGDLAGRLEYYHIRTYNPRFYSLLEGGGTWQGGSNITIYGHVTLDSTP